jgi:hypothetical protein
MFIPPPTTIARQVVSKPLMRHRRFLRGPCRIKGNLAISSSQSVHDLLFILVNIIVLVYVAVPSTLSDVKTTQGMRKTLAYNTPEKEEKTSFQFSVNKQKLQCCILYMKHHSPR